MWATLIILAILAIAITPLLKFMPTKLQRKISQMREYAATHGLFVEFRDIPGHAAVRRQAGVRPGSVIYYGKRLPASRAEPRSAIKWVRAEDDWHAVGKWRAIPAELGSLPASVLAASVDESSCGVYWSEAGELEDVAQICAAVEAWSERLIK